MTATSHFGFGPTAVYRLRMSLFAMIYHCRLLIIQYYSSHFTRPLVSRHSQPEYHITCVLAWVGQEISTSMMYVTLPLSCHLQLLTPSQRLIHTAMPMFMPVFRVLLVADVC
jgi:hypothetical protein